MTPSTRVTTNPCVALSRWQVRAYEQGEPKFVYDDGPFAAFDRPLSQATIALITAGGVYVDGHDPMPGESQEQAVTRIDDYLRQPPALSAIPNGTPLDQLRVRHPGYDVRGAARDVGTVFPLAALSALVEDGVVGAASATHYSFVGAASQLSLRKRLAPAWAEQLRAHEIDACLLVAT